MEEGEGGNAITRERGEDFERDKGRCVTKLEEGSVGDITNLGSE